MEEIKIDFANKRIEMLLDNKALKSVHVGAQKIAERLSESGFNVKQNDLKITLNASDFDFKAIYKLKEKIKETIISGIKNISQVVISSRGKDFVILTAGSNVREIIELKGVDKNRTLSNDIYDVMQTLGIEAARKSLRP